MKKMLTIEGTVAGQPRCRGEFTEFTLKSGPRDYRIIRIDKQWQIRDLLFLCHGQRVQVTGREDEMGILVETAVIIDCSARSYYEEKQYGNSCVTETDPGDSEL